MVARFAEHLIAECSHLVRADHHRIGKARATARALANASRPDSCSHRFTRMRRSRRPSATPRRTAIFRRASSSRRYGEVDARINGREAVMADCPTGLPATARDICRPSPGCECAPYTEPMRGKKFDPRHLDIRAFADRSASLEGVTPVRQFKRLNASTHPDAPASADDSASWRVAGEVRAVRGAPAQPGLHLDADVLVHLTCQRCLQAVTTPLHVDADFIFVPDEATAAEQDVDSEADILVESRSFNLLALIEDELLLALPLVPRHDGAMPAAAAAARRLGGERIRRTGQSVCRVGRYQAAQDDRLTSGLPPITAHARIAGFSERAYAFSGGDARRVPGR